MFSTHHHDERLDKVNEGLLLLQKKEGLTFGTDAFLLASYLVPKSRARAVELGAGTGIVSLLAAQKNKFSSVVALEIQEDFAHLIQRNAEANGLAHKVFARHGDVRSFDAVALGFEADLVFANPPYMRSDSGAKNRSDAKYIARHEVCGGIEDFCSCAGRLLKHGGEFVCVFRPDRMSELFSALHKAHLEPKRLTMVHADRLSPPSMLLLSAKKGASPSLRVTPPLILHDAEETVDGSRPLSQTAQEIYDTLLFPKSHQTER